MTLPAGASDVVRVGGGDINEAWGVTLDDGTSAFVKTRPDAQPGEYEREAAGLRWLAEPRTLQVPQVLDVGADYLALEWIDELAGPVEPPARLHGDLWSGNVLAGVDGRPWLIDPTAYGDHREVDIAMLLLFGAPSQRFFAAYEEVEPLAAGWRERVQLWQLLPLLVHAALFGGGYGSQAAQVALHYAR